jgi:hypothetical protein
MATDAGTTDDWRNRFKPMDLGETLDLTGPARPQRCLAEVTVRTR